MTTENPAAEAAVADPSPEIPEMGIVRVAIEDHPVEISHVEHWFEDGVYVFRSTEFDCMGEAEDLGDAVRAFIENAEDLFRFLDDLVDAGRATEAEQHTLIKLSRRFFEVYEARQLQLEAESNHRIRNLLRLLRQSRQSPWQWQAQPAAHASSSRLSHA